MNPNHPKFPNHPKRGIFRLTLPLALFVGIGIGIATGYLARGNSTNTQEPQSTITCNYPFLNPTRCNETEVYQKSEYASLTSQLTRQIEELEKDGQATEVAIYFRDLENGPIVRINEETHFAPASLLKVPLLMAVLKKSEEDPAFLDKKLMLQTELTDDIQEIEPEKSIVKDTVYTIEDLIYKMIVHSDNKSTFLLQKELEKDAESETWYEMVLSDLGIKDFTLNETTGNDILSVRDYAAIFRILYNASYLSPENSEKALSLLAQSEFDDGIVAGIPEGTNVSHKFGVRDLPNEGVDQLHDCGIVYYSENHYLLCIMTKGKDVSTLTTVIQDISKSVFEEVQRRN